MARVFLAAAFGLGLVTGLGGIAAAQEKSSPLPAQLPLGKEACFGRVYDAKHLAQHPKQQVTSFHLAREFTPDPNTEDEPMSAQDMLDADGSDGLVNVTAYVRFRNRPGVFSNVLSCSRNEKGAVRCGIDCDGGSFNVKTSGPSLLIENEGFVVVGGCGGTEEDQDNAVHVAPGKDDRTFRLDSKPMAACSAERDARAPSFSKLGAPLRERFAKSETLCLSRAYDAAHLSGHPQQNVRRIAILKTAESRKGDDRPDYDLVFRVETKDGKKTEQKANCVPDTYAFVCSFSKGPSAYGEFYLARAGADQVMLRDRKNNLAKLTGLKLGRDDTMFRLGTSAAEACAF